MTPACRVAATLFFILLSSDAPALDAFGFSTGQSPQQVESTAKNFNLGVAKWFGKSLIVQAQDSQEHSYLFNFCNERLYSISQTFPAKFERLAGFVDQSIQSYGQPMFISAAGGVGPSGFVRPINFYWRVGSTDYLRVMQLESSYTLIYETENPCTKVPN